MVERYGQIQLFLPTLLRTLDFQATTGGQATLKSIDFLRNCLPNLTKADFANAPREAVSSGWKNRLVDAHGRVARRAYVVWATYRLRDALRRHDLYLQRSERWGNVQLELIQPAEWHMLRPQMCRALDLSISGAVEIARLSAELDQAYQEVNAGLPQNPFARIEGKDKLIITPLEGQEEPESLKLVREQVKAMLPWVDLPELLLEIEARTQFADDFTPILPEYGRDPDLALSLCAALLAEACNIGLGPVARADHPALELERLAFVQQNYLRPETIARANTRLVEAQCSLRLAQVWGGPPPTVCGLLCRSNLPMHCLIANTSAPSVASPCST
jgi:hypothetical protein